MTPEEEAALVSYGHSPTGRRWQERFRHTPLRANSVERIRGEHQPGLNYGQHGPKVPHCRACRQAWPCDASRLLDTLYDLTATVRAYDKVLTEVTS